MRILGISAYYHDSAAALLRTSRRCPEHFERTQCSGQAFERYARLFDRLAA